MIKSGLCRAVFASSSALGLFIGVATPAIACDQWLAPSRMVVQQSNGPVIGFTVIQVGTAIHGFASYQTTQRTIVGNYAGTIVGDVFHARVLWTYSGVSAIGQYSGRIKPLAGVSDPKGYVFEGTTYDEYRQPPDLQYWNAYHFTCAPAASPPPPPTAAPPLVTIISRPYGDSVAAKRSHLAVQGEKNAYADQVASRVTTETNVTAELFLATRASPTLPAPTPAPAPGPAAPINIDALAEKGATLSTQIPLAEELRSREPDASAQRGFDIGMAAAEGDTLPGPGKQRIHDALPASEQPGFEDALAFSLDWNRDTDLARKGAAIAENRPNVAQARKSDPDPLYWLGFDIAAGLFDDRAPGSLGHTGADLDPMAIRDALGARAQRGFDASREFYQRR